MRIWFLVIALASVAAAKPGRVRIHIEDNPIAIQCHIPLEASNRHINLGVDGYFSSGIQLEGLPSDPPHVRRPVPALLCDPGETSAMAFCELFWAPNGYARAVAPVPCLPN